MLYYENGDMLKGNYSFIVHQVNCKGVMGAGIAKQIRAKCPQVYQDYIRALKYENAGLGHIVVSRGANQTIVSIMAQNGYGRDRRYTDYPAFAECLHRLSAFVNDYSVEKYPTIAFPYRIGCGLAGGDWNIIRGMLEGFSETVKQKVVVVCLK